MKLSTTLKIASVAIALLVSSLSFAASVNIGTNDVAIRGYDPVAYFTKNKPVEGSAKYTATHQGAIYRFSSSDNRDLFKSDPERYAPQFGGYCAMGVFLNKKLDVDPAAFHIADNKLFLNLNKAVQKKWLTDVDGHVKAANRVWNGIEALPVAEVNAEE
ncbi:YHS domain-containing (seleno)protein [Aurantivibrio plasticivorans]